MKKLPNYLRAFRKRAGLSQKELAFLFDDETQSSVCKHEHGREPDLRYLLAYEYIFRTSCQELFAGAYQKVGQRVLAKARTLHGSLSRRPHTPERARKITFLKNLLASHEEAVRHL